MQRMKIARSLVICWLVLSVLGLEAAGAAQDPGAARRSGEATPAEALEVLPGFKAQLLRSSRPGEGSWVSMTIDNKGRLIVSPQDKEPMLRFTIGADGTIAR